MNSLTHGRRCRRCVIDAMNENGDFNEILYVCILLYNTWIGERLSLLQVNSIFSGKWILFDWCTSPNSNSKLNAGNHWRYMLCIELLCAIDIEKLKYKKKWQMNLPLGVLELECTFFMRTANRISNENVLRSLSFSWLVLCPVCALCIWFIRVDSVEWLWKNLPFHLKSFSTWLFLLFYA